jgi:hypothetical protein
MNEDTDKIISVRTKGQLPIYPPYNKELFYKISYPELLVDIVLILFSFYASHILFSKTGIFFFLSSSQIATLYLILVLTLPWQLGYTYAKNSEYYSKPVMHIFLCVLIFMVLSIMIMVLRLVFPGNGYEGDSLTTIGWLTFLFVAIGSLSPFGGAYSYSARADYTRNEEGSLEFDIEIITNPRSAYLVIILTIILLVNFIKLIGPGSGLLFVLSFLGSPVLAMLGVAIFNYLLVLLDKMGVYRYLVVLARNVFPLFIITVLVFWSGTTMYSFQVCCLSGY